MLYHMHFVHQSSSVTQEFHQYSLFLIAHSRKPASLIKNYREFQEYLRCQVQSFLLSLYFVSDSALSATEIANLMQLRPSGFSCFSKCHPEVINLQRL